jgi:hypothetical protein
MDHMRAPLKRDEAKIQDAICDMLRMKGWFVKETHGNMFQQGFPDIYATHSSYGARWIEVKKPTGYRFTGAQLEDFPKLVAHGSGVWIMVAATEEEYLKLFKSCNWYQYLSGFTL